MKPRKKQMKTPHKHAAIIKAWADGAEIEFLTHGPILYSTESRWLPAEGRCWFSDVEYRIKPESKPDKTVSRWVYTDGSTAGCSQSNVRYTFDGETGKLKAAEVL